MKNIWQNITLIEEFFKLLLLATMLAMPIAFAGDRGPGSALSHGNLSDEAIRDILESLDTPRAREMLKSMNHRHEVFEQSVSYVGSSKLKTRTTGIELINAYRNSDVYTGVAPNAELESGDEYQARRKKLRKELLTWYMAVKPLVEDDVAMMALIEEINKDIAAEGRRDRNVKFVAERVKMKNFKPTFSENLGGYLGYRMFKKPKNTSWQSDRHGSHPH